MLNRRGTLKKLSLKTDSSDIDGNWPCYHRAKKKYCNLYGANWSSCRRNHAHDGTFQSNFTKRVPIEYWIRKSTRYLGKGNCRFTLTYGRRQTRLVWICFVYVREKYNYGDFLKEGSYPSIRRQNNKSQWNNRLKSKSFANAHLIKQWGWLHSGQNSRRDKTVGLQDNYSRARKVVLSCQSYDWSTSCKHGKSGGSEPSLLRLLSSGDPSECHQTFITC